MKSNALLKSPNKRPSVPLPEKPPELNTNARRNSLKNVLKLLPVRELRRLRLPKRQRKLAREPSKKKKDRGELDKPRKSRDYVKLP